MVLVGRQETVALVFHRLSQGLQSAEQVVEVVELAVAAVVLERLLTVAAQVEATELLILAAVVVALFLEALLLVLTAAQVS
jgi:hypothetical protein